LGQYLIKDPSSRDFMMFEKSSHSIIFSAYDMDTSHLLSLPEMKAFVSDVRELVSSSSPSPSPPPQPQIYDSYISTLIQSLNQSSNLENPIPNVVSFDQFSSFLSSTQIHII